MSPMVSQISSLTIVYSTVYSGTDQRKHQSSASLAFVVGIYRWPVNSTHKLPVTRKMSPFDDVIMYQKQQIRITVQNFEDVPNTIAWLQLVYERSSSLWPSDALWCQRTRSSLLPNGPRGTTSMKFQTLYHFYPRKYFRKCRLQMVGHFLQASLLTFWIHIYGIWCMG